MALNGREKTMMLLSLLGEDASSKILDHLPDDLADIIANGVEKLPSPSKGTLTSVLTEATDFLSTGTIKKQEIIQRQAPVPSYQMAAPPPPPKPKPSSPKEAVMQAPANVLTTLLFKERPQLIAFLLSSFKKEGISAVLANLPEQRRDIEVLLSSLRPNVLTEKLKNRFFDILSKKVDF